jgi:hypothetical protein
MVIKAILNQLARLFGLLPSPEVERILRKTDAESIRSDWEAVGGDLRRAMEEYDRQCNA